MATLTITKNYDDNTLLTEAQLDKFIDDPETFINTTKVNDDNIQTGGINGSLKIKDASISTAKIANLAVTTAKINTGAVTAAKLADSSGTDADRSVTSDHIKDLNVTTAKINASAVTTAKLAASAVTNTKLSSLVASTATLTDQTPLTYSSGFIVSGDTSYTDTRVIKTFDSIAVSGSRPVFCFLTLPNLRLTTSGSSGGLDLAVELIFYRDSTIIGKYKHTATGAEPTADLKNFTHLFVDTPSANTYVYSVRARVIATATSATNYSLAVSAPNLSSATSGYAMLYEL